MRRVGGIVAVAANSTSGNVLRDTPIANLFRPARVRVCARVQEASTVASYDAADAVNATFASASVQLANNIIVASNATGPAANTFGVVELGVGYSAADEVFMGTSPQGQLELTFRNNTDAAVNVAWFYEVS